MRKEFIEANDLIRDSFALAREIYDSGYRPDVILVLWRGGTPVGMAIHEFLLYKGIRTYHTAVKAESYTGIGTRVEPRIENLGPVLDRLSPDSRVLVIDDIFDTGCTVRKVREQVLTRTPHVRVATLYYKIGHNRTDVEPDFCFRKTENWVVFPHELMDLSLEEIRQKSPRLHELLTR